MSRAQQTKRGSAARRAAAVAWFVSSVAACAPAGPATGDVGEASPAPMSSIGSYLAARHAQQARDYGHAAEFMNRALAEDPGNNDLVRRTFVLRVSEGRVAEAVPLAQRIVELDQT